MRPNSSFKIVDNFADGNCMYLAYCISLMYHLRKESEENRNLVFKNLGLDEEKKGRLKKILLEHQSDNLYFTTRELYIIQTILGKACRETMAHRAFLEFQSDPAYTQIYATSISLLKKAFLEVIRADIAEDSSLVGNNQQLERFVNLRIVLSRDILSADLFKVESLYRAAKKFAQDKKIRESFLHKTQYFQNYDFLLDSIAQEQIISFFSDGDYANLKTYLSYISTDKVWGSEENLMILHRAVVGEKMVRHSEDMVSFEHEIDIKLGVFNFTSFFPEADIVIKNIHNVHWVSCVPHMQVACDNDRSLEKLLENQDTICKEIAKLEACKKKSKGDLQNSSCFFNKKPSFKFGLFGVYIGSLTIGLSFVLPITQIVAGIILLAGIIIAALAIIFLVSLKFCDRNKFSLNDINRKIQSLKKDLANLEQEVANHLPGSDEQQKLSPGAA